MIFGKDEKMKKGLIVSSIIAAALLLCSLSTPIPADEKEDNNEGTGEGTLQGEQSTADID